MKLHFKSVFFLVTSLSIWLSGAQGNFFLKNDVSKKINFEFVSNLIIIPLEINGVTLSFVLDSGVSKPILFKLTENDSLNLKNTKTFYLHGLGGDGKLEALKSSGNAFRFGDVVGQNMDLYVVFDSSIDFTPRLGVLVHGIIGYDVFKDFVVEINYNSKFIRLHRPSTFKPKTSKKWRTMPIEVYRKKPYIDAMVAINNEEQRVKLLIDTGSSDALWLFENDKGLKPNEDMFFMDYLGKGLSGSVYGKRSKVNAFKLDDFGLKDVNVAYPDTLSIDLTRVYKERNGSLGGDILKRFNLFFDYKNQQLHLKKNTLFKDEFTYNNSGIVLEFNGTRFVREKIRLPSSSNYGGKFGGNNSSSAVQIDLSVDYRIALKPIYEVVELRESSNAFAAGLRVGDILISVNGKEVYDFKLPEVNAVFHGRTGKSIKLKVERNGETMNFKFKLDNAFTKKEPSD